MRTITLSICLLLASSMKADCQKNPITDGADPTDSPQVTLFLTSSGMGRSSEWLAPLLPFEPAGHTVCYITTAAAFGGDTPDWMNHEIQSVENLGFNVKRIDLTNLTSSDLAREFSNADLIWVGGGNTLYLLQEIRRTRFDTYVKKKISEGVPYVGVSAGSVIAGPDIGIELYASKTPELPSYEGLNLFPYVTFVHFGNPEYKEIYRDILLYSLDVGLSFITLRDNQFIYIHGDNWRVIDIE